MKQFAYKSNIVQLRQALPIIFSEKKVHVFAYAIKSVILYSTVILMCTAVQINGVPTVDNELFVIHKGEQFDQM